MKKFFPALFVLTCFLQAPCRLQAQSDRGRISGVPPGILHGFLMERGTFTTIDVPGAAFTEARGINVNVPFTSA